MPKKNEKNRLKSKRLKRLKSHQIRRNKERAKNARIYQLAKTIHTQEQLNNILSNVPHRLVRQEVFHKLKPILSFDAVYPEEIAKTHDPEAHFSQEHLDSVNQYR